MYSCIEVGLFHTCALAINILLELNTVTGSVSQDKSKIVATTTVSKATTPKTGQTTPKKITKDGRSNNVATTKSYSQTTRNKSLKTIQACANKPVSPPYGECCPTLPNFSTNATMQTCVTKCTDDTNKKCCLNECIMDSFGVLTNGKFDATKAKDVLKKALINKPKWFPIIDSVVDNCTAEAPNKVKDYQNYQLQAKKMAKGNKLKSSDTTPCKYPQNGFIGHCIRRNLFLNCPDATASKPCEDLVKYTEKCPMACPNQFQKKVQKNENQQKTTNGKGKVTSKPTKSTKEKTNKQTTSKHPNSATTKRI
uniref:Odorant-binding protein 16 n=1 Tax=Propsilocerus akamusi TaxID=903466 RepID=A0A7D0TEJ4_9DIPT|nr:odorant-binding protein 16 [Propsilocerus akamusi]